MYAGLEMPRAWRPYVFLAGVALSATATTYLYIRRRQAQRRALEGQPQARAEAEAAEEIPEFLRARPVEAGIAAEESAAPEQTQAS